MLPPTDESVRGYGISGFQKFSKLDDGNWLLDSYMQLDYSMDGELMKRLADTASVAALPSQMKEWWTKFYKQLSLIEKFDPVKELSYYDL